MAVAMRGVRALLSVVALASPLIIACSDDGPGLGQARDGTATPVLEGAAATLAGLLDRGLSATYQATYRTVFEGERGDTYVVYNRPPLARTDTVPDDPSEPPSTLITGEGGTTVSCSDEPGGWECFEIEPLGESLVLTAGPVIYPGADDLARSNVVESESITIAGQAARCFQLLPPGGATRADAEYCLTRQGVPLYAEANFAVVEATEFSAEVRDPAFSPPVEPRS